MLTEPQPPATRALRHRHLALRPRRWRSSRATRRRAREAELEALTAVMAHEAFKTTLKDLPLLTNLQIASRIVRGELAGRAGRHDEAVRPCCARPSRSRTRIPYNEPPVWHQPTRQVLGALLLRGGTAARGRGGLSRGPGARPRERLVAVRPVRRASRRRARPTEAARGARAVREGLGARRRHADVVSSWLRSTRIVGRPGPSWRPACRTSKGEATW